MSLKTILLCTNCKEVLNSQDDIYATSCGHLYHFMCLHECHNKETICTHCKAYKPFIYKMCLEFGEAPEPSSWENHPKTINLLRELEEKSNILNNLEKKHNFSQVSVQQLEGELKKLNDALISSSTEITNLQDRVFTYEKLNIFLTNEIELIVTNRQIGTRECESENSTPNKGKGGRLKLLEDRLNEEIAKTKSINNRYEKNLSANVSDNNNYENSIDSTKEKKEIPTQNLDSCTIPCASPPNLNENKDSGNVGKLEQIVQNPGGSNNSIIIRNLLIRDLEKWGLEETVIFLAKKMCITLPKKEVNAIQIPNCSKYADLIVYFNSIYFKSKFLQKKDHLCKFNNTKHIKILD